MGIPITVIIVTKNEEQNLPRCLDSLIDFEEVIVVDSNSDDATRDIAKSYGVKVFDFKWNGKYPKKRQWCLDNIKTENDWVFFLDADEAMSSSLSWAMQDVMNSDLARHAGFFVESQYVWNGRQLYFGLRNNKLALIHKERMHFPIVDDLDIQGMGEIEGHYQPVRKSSHLNYKIKKLTGSALHYVDDLDNWRARHKRYAHWEREMNKRRAWPSDPSAYRQFLKKVFRWAPFRSSFVFWHSYLYKLGFLDGHAGKDFARHRALYYKLINTRTS